MVDVHNRVLIMDDDEGLLKRLALLAIAPLVGLAYVILLPFFGLAAFLGLPANRLFQAVHTGPSSA